jgi:hypothetical protein
MAKTLTQSIAGQIARQDIKSSFIFKVDGVDFSSYLISWSLDNSKAFGSASATFTLHNVEGIFGDAGAYKLNVGNVIEFIETYRGDATEFKKFYGTINQRSFSKQGGSRVATINCLDYIANLQFLDIDFIAEANKVEITNETLAPNYLPAPNASLAQLFDFYNNAISDSPSPVLIIRARDGNREDPQFDGFQVYYDVGQVKLGSPLNALENYDVIAKSYYFYPRGLYVEDILEDILTLEDGYGNYLFGEASAQAVIDNHLIETFNNVEGTSTDYLTPNLLSANIPIYTKLTQAYDPDASGGDPTTLYVTSTEGFPTSGQAEIAGDTFTWTGKTATTLTGISLVAPYSLKKHPVEAYVKYSAHYGIGQVWYLKYTNITSALTSSDFSIPSGATLQYFDARYGRIILNNSISISSNVTCTTNYSFKTLQATGVELNKISFRSRETDNRMDAVKKLKDYLAPNYVIRTRGDNKIWSSYLNQNTVADYNLSLITQINYLEDEDLYTRVKFYGKNKNPTNIMFNDGVHFDTTGESYSAVATQDELSFNREEGDYYVYQSAISGAGSIDTTSLTPLVYINGVPINNTLQLIPQSPVTVVIRTRTETSTDGKGNVDEVQTYYDYDVYFTHGNIDISYPITIYNNAGAVVYTIPAGDPTGRGGKWTIGGGVQNSLITTFSTASYKVFYSTGDLIVDTQNVEFKIRKSLLPSHLVSVITATYEYHTVMTFISGISNIIDGRWDTQVQTIFFAEPPTGYNYAILDLGAVYNIQALDLVAGFFKPDDIRKFDVDMRLTIHSSLDNVTYREISDKTHAFDLTGGASKSFEENDLGTDFQVRYLKLIIENLNKIEWSDNPNNNNPGVWVVALSEVAAYEDIIISSEATLIPTTYLLSDVEVTLPSGTFPTSIRVNSTAGFSSSGTAYIDDDTFTYTSLTTTEFLGVEGLSEDHLGGDRVTQELEGDNTLYDNDAVLPLFGDRVFKKVDVDPEKLYDQARLDALTKAYLAEFVKNHSKINIDIMYAPYLEIGQTVSLTDPYQGYTNVHYFIESISDNNGSYSLVLARYSDYVNTTTTNFTTSSSSSSSMSSSSSSRSSSSSSSSCRSSSSSSSSSCRSSSSSSSSST